MPMPFRFADRFRPVSIPDRWLLLLHEFRRFGTVGAAGFVVDTAVIYALRSSVGLYVASLISYLVAATVTWALHRAWTFAGRARDGLLRQWVLFLGANGVGAVLNRGMFFVLVWLLPICAAHPVLAVMAGVAAGMFANFSMSRRLVFRVQP